MAIFRIAISRGQIIMATSATAVKELEVEEIENKQFLSDVVDDLGREAKRLQPKYFYDEVGSTYFDQICHLPEYYPYRAELELLPKVSNDLANFFDKEVAVVEFGAGSLQKIRPLLKNVSNIKRFIPIDISGEHLRESTAQLQNEFPEINMQAIEADFTRTVGLPDGITEKKVGFFPGSTIGNFQPIQAIDFLSTVAKTLGKDSYLIIGVDTKKTPKILHSAYNDSDGVTAKFNRNILYRINRELLGTFDPATFDHYAFYNISESCIEMHLVSSVSQSVEIAGHTVSFDEGESIHTENSYKYSPTDFRQLVKQAGWTVEKVWLAKDDMFSTYLLRSVN